MDAVGQQYYEVLHFLEDDTYVKHANVGFSDRGRYQLEGETLSFESDVDQRHSRDLSFKITNGNKLALEFAPAAFGQHSNLFKQTEEWTRTGRRPYLQTVEKAGRYLPTALPKYLASVFESAALPWSSDAVPTGIRLEELPNGYFETTFEFYSRAFSKILRVRIEPYRFRKTIHEVRHAPKQALPPDFTDLYVVVDEYRTAGNSAAVNYADLRVWGKYGPVWRFRVAGRGFPSYSAVSGTRITEDVTGYIDQYNADWARAGVLWEKALAKYTKERGPDCSFGSCYLIDSVTWCSGDCCEWDVLNQECDDK